jgi:type IV pilus assembly protein PilB
MSPAATSDKRRMEAAELPPPSRELQPAASRLPLGILLLRDGLITANQLEQALEEREGTGRRLGEIVVDHGWASSVAIAQCLAEQHDLEFIDLSHTEVDPAATALLPEQLARQYQALPIQFLDEELVQVAVSDPTNVVTSDNLRLAIGLSVRMAVVGATDLEEAIGRVYRTKVEVEDEQPAEEEDPKRVALPVEDLHDDVSTSAPAIKLVNKVITNAIEEGASDIHFEPQAEGLVVRARIDGVMRRVTDIPKTMQAAVTSRLKIMAELDIAERRAPQDGRVAIRVAGEPTDLRMAVLPTTYGEQVVLRILHRATGRLGLSFLGMSDAAEKAFLQAISEPYGAVMTVGPTGSGKTTTLYAALDVLNSEDRVVTTIEDPVEYQIPGITQIEVNPKAGLTFSRGLRTMLRSDPDVLLVGEIRDEETARIAIQAAMTGHLVLTTLHAHNAASAIARLKDMGVDAGLLASSVNCIVAQRLARRLCADCRRAYLADGDERAELGLEHLTEEIKLYRGEGCLRCGNTGYRGRVALYEVMPIEGRLTRMFDQPTEEIYAAAVEQGMTTLRQDGVRLCLAGITSLGEIRRVTGDRPS